MEIWNILAHYINLFVSTHTQSEWKGEEKKNDLKEIIKTITHETILKHIQCKQKAFWYTRSLYLDTLMNILFSKEKEENGDKEKICATARIGGATTFEWLFSDRYLNSFQLNFAFIAKYPKNCAETDWMCWFFFAFVL